jgi:hypothetical protein
MDPTHHSENALQPTAVPPRRSVWKKLGGGSLSISLFLHLIILLIGVIWVFQIIPADPPKDVTFLPRSGGGPSPASDKLEKKHQVRMAQPSLSRVVALGTASNFVLPEPEELTQMTSLGSISGGSLSKDLGGPGAGGGKGPGFGNGLVGGMSDGTGTKNPFGGLTQEPSALVGTFYDLKQTRAGKPTNLDLNGAVAAINDFVNQGWRESSFNKYYKASNTLYQSKLYIPSMNAEGAPAAFNCADQVKPSQWAVVYRGMITPPHTGKYRFVGHADDILVIRFNGKNVFDHGYFSGTTPVMIYAAMDFMKGTREDADLKKQLRRNYPMEHPLKTYTYDSTPIINGSLGGLGIGPVFEAAAGQSYPIDILLSELPGGIFSASLLIEEIGATYEKDPTGSPILPLFRSDRSAPAEPTPGSSPPYAPDGPVWKVTGTGGKLEF